MASLAGRQLLLLNLDAAGVQSRQLLDKMVAAEQPAAAPTAQPA